MLHLGDCWGAVGAVEQAAGAEQGECLLLGGGR